MMTQLLLDDDEGDVAHASSMLLSPTHKTIFLHAYFCFCRQEAA